MKIGSIQSLWRFPVKSFQGEQLQEAYFGQQGLIGDRSYALIETDTGKVVTAKSVRHYPDLLFCQAQFLEEPQPGNEAPPVKITLPNGTEFLSSDDDCDDKLSEYFKRNLTLARSAPEDYTIDQYHPNVEQLNPTGSKDVSVEQKLGSALFKSMGVDSPISEGSFMDVFPISIITTSTLEALKSGDPSVNFNERRFRMNITLATKNPGFIENQWIGKTLQTAQGVVFAITMPDPRCVMTSLEQKDIPKDSRVLRTMVENNRLDIMGSGKYPCAGVYGVVPAGGKVQLGDQVQLR